MTSDDQPSSPVSARQAAVQNGNNNVNEYNKRIWNIAETIESDKLSSLPQSSSTRPTLQRSTSILLRSTSLRKSLRRLDSSNRLSITCSGSELGQLYLSSPETDTLSLFNNASRSYKSLKSSESWGNVTLDSSSGSSDDLLHHQQRSSSSSSWLYAADLYGRRKSYRRHSSYARFLDIDVMSNILEEDDYNDNDVEMKSFLIEEADTDEHGIDTWSKLRRCWRWFKSPLVVVPAMMVLDLVLGVSLSLYDSNLLRNVPGFHFPLTYALVQKMTNAIASLVLIYISRKWEKDDRRNRPIDEHQGGLAEMPSLKTFRHHASSLTAVALVQTFSSAFANEALQEIPLPLFKVVLMCGPIFVAFITTIMEGQIYSRGRLFALLLIGFGAGRAVYAEAEKADNPREILQGAGYALGASAFSGIALVLSSVLMHKDNEHIDEEEEVDLKDASKLEMELNPLSLLFYLSCEQVMMLSFYLALDAFDGTDTEQPKSPEQLSEFAAFLVYFVEDPPQAVFYLLVGSILSLTLAVLTFVLVNCTSPVATSLLGNVRSISTVAISSLLFQGVAGRGGVSSSGDGLFGPAATGYLLSLAGGVAYAFAALARDNGNNAK